MGINRIGKRGKQWLKDRIVLVKEAVLAGRIQLDDKRIMGKCEDCKEWKELDPDHNKKRSQGGNNEKGNIVWRCRKCHNKLDNMPDSKKQKGKKASWEVRHECINCGVITRQYLCHSCGKVSIK